MREVLRKARKGKGMTQQQVADAVGISFRHYQDIEYGVVTGNVVIWDKLEDLFTTHQRKLREMQETRPAQANNL